MNRANTDTAYRGRLRSQWLPAGLSSDLFITLTAFLSGLFMIRVSVLSLITQFVIIGDASREITNQALGTVEIKVGIGIEIDEGTLIQSVDVSTGAIAGMIQPIGRCIVTRGRGQIRSGIRLLLWLGIV